MIPRMITQGSGAVAATPRRGEASVQTPQGPLPQRDMLQLVQPASVPAGAVRRQWSWARERPDPAERNLSDVTLAHLDLEKMPSWNEGVSLKRILTKLSNRTAPLAHLPEMPAERSLEYHALCWPMPYHLGPLRVAGEPTKEEMTLVVNEIRPDPSPEIRELVYRTLGAVQQRGQCDWLEQRNGVSIYVSDIRSDEITGQFSAVADIVSLALHVKYSALKRLVIANASYEIADVKFFDPTVADALFLESVSRRRGKGRSVTEAMQALLAGWCVWAGKQRVQGQFIPSLKDVLMQEGSIRNRDCINAYEEEFNRANKEKRGEKPWSRGCPGSKILKRFGVCDVSGP